MQPVTKQLAGQLFGHKPVHTSLFDELEDVCMAPQLFFELFISNTLLPSPPLFYSSGTDC